MRRLNNPPHINKEMPVRGEQKKESGNITSKYPRILEELIS